MLLSPLVALLNAFARQTVHADARGSAQCVSAAFTWSAAQAQRGNGQCGIGRRRGREDGRAEDEEIRMVVAAEVAVDPRACRIAAHSSRANDVSGAFGDVAMLDLRGAEAGEDLRMSIASEARLDVGARGYGKARQRHAVDVQIGGVERYAILRVRQLLDQRGEAELAARLGPQRVVQGLAPQTEPRKVGRPGGRRAAGPRPAIIADLDAEGGPLFSEWAVPKVLDAGGR
jgi:hypothetical protein